MSRKIILILSDAMRPDAVISCGHPTAKRFMDKSYYSLNAQTIMPSVTLPCHMSLFFGVPAERHGIVTNKYVPMPNPVDGLISTLAGAGKTNAMFYTWGPLRDISRSLYIAYSLQVSGSFEGYKVADDKVTEECIKYIKEKSPDFVFLYFGETDAVGHDNGWMGEEYMDAVRRSWDRIEKIDREIDGYDIIVTADHGGHNRGHGTDMPEDMLIPIFLKGRDINPGKFEGGSILDIAPTITSLFGIAPVTEWEGKSLL